MSQLQSVLRRSVAHLDPSDHDGRERVFVNAREAMIRLLWSYDPPLSPKEIDSKIDEFDDIVAAILDEAPSDEDDGIDEIPADDERADDDLADEALADPGPDDEVLADEDLADANQHDAAPVPPEPPALSEPAALAQPVFSDRRAEALAILRRPSRFEPMPQIGSPSPGAADRSGQHSSDLADGESALLAKQAVEQALARLNGRLAPTDDDELLAVDPDDDEALAEDEVVPDHEDLPDDEDLPDEEDLPGDDDLPDDEAPPENDDLSEDENAPEDEDDIAPEDVEAENALDEEPGNDTDDADAGDETDESEDDTDEADAAAVDEPSRTGSHVAHRRHDEDADDAPSDDPFDDEEAARPTLGARLADAIGRIRGGTLAAIAAIVILLAGGLLGTAYFLGRDSEPPVTAAAPEPQPVAPVTPSQPAPSQPTPEPAATPAPAATPEPVQPQAEIPSGGLALETLSLFDGRDPSVFQSSPDNPIRFEGDTLGGFARIASSSNGARPRITVGRGVFERLAGRTVRIVVVARAAANAPASSLRFSYQNGRSVSPWHDAELGADYAPLSLTWTVPKERGGPETDAVMIEPGIPGDGTAADVSSVRIEILK